mmetsp:Transcript_108348/g.258547  ORF Transcript_108348/g.258547 Transcript_108348/m.258547 type:complete len:550 (-) Transcript_108348:60-1709(-)
MFEVKILEVMSPLEDPNARSRVPLPRSQLRIGFGSVKCNLFLGHTEDAIGFDSEGFLLQGKNRTPVAQKFSTGDVVAVVLNQISSSPNAHTVSLFKNGKRISQPQPVPQHLREKALYPLLTFKNVSLQYNFGPVSLAPLPFKCRMVNEVLQPDVCKKKEHTQHAEGQYEVLFPISLPDEGGFDWLDQFLIKNPHYVELSDRSLLNWCEKSGLLRPKGYNILAKGSNDKPEMGMGITALDDLSVRRVLNAVAPIQQRNYVVMEVRANLLKEERAEQLPRWLGFKRVAAVILGEPPQVFKKYSQDVSLRVKQEVSDIEFKAKQVQEKQQFMLQKRQKQMEKDKKKAAKKAAKAQDAMLKRMKYEQLKKEAEAKGEVPPDPPEEEDEEEEDPGILGFKGGIFWLGLITVFIATLSQWIVDTIEGAAASLGMPILFISGILVPIVGNAAEHAASVVFAYRNKMEIALGSAVGSAVQISVFVIPLCVVIGWIVQKPMTMNFHIFETSTMLLTSVSIAIVLMDGKANWLKGAMLLLGYAIVGAGFWAHADPGQMQ